VSRNYQLDASEQLRLGAAKHPDRTLLGFPDESISYQDFYELSLRISRGLSSLGIGEGDAIGILALNTIHGMAALYGAMRIGVVPVPINNRFKEHELPYIFEHAELSALVTADRDIDPICFAEMVNRVWPPQSGRHRIQLGDVDVPGFIAREEFLRLGDDVSLAAGPVAADGTDTAILMYTSGTTGHPRGCLLSHACLVIAAYNLVDRMAITEDDILWDVLPFFHLSGVLPLLTMIIAGGSMLSMRHFEPGAALDQLERNRVTVALPAFETIWMRVLTQPDFEQRDLSNIRVIQNVGVENRLRLMQNTLPRAIQVSNYGMTELGGYATMHKLTDSIETRVTSSGPPLGEMELRIVDEDGSALPHGTLGEIVARGDQMFSGYFKDPQATTETVRDGWFHTGDIGRMNELGHLIFVGRRKDMLKVGGENVAAAEIETYLVTHPAIQIAAVVAAEDERYGQVPAVFVQLRAGTNLTEAELMEYCVGKIATYKVPRYVRFVDEWPMSGTKIQKFRLREAIDAELQSKKITSAPKVDAPAHPTSAGGR
jgi:fatty-acyl-CoA synthase